jgi:hypothetical protein
MSTISASTTTTTAYKVTADTTGALVLQTGATPTTAVTIDTSQNVGIGTSSPATKLEVSGSATAQNYLLNVNAATFGKVSDTSIEMATSADATPRMLFRVNGSTERMRIDSSGNVGIGTTSPNGKLAVLPASNITTVAASTTLTLGETTNNSAYQLRMAYSFLSSTYTGVIDAVQNSAGAPLAVNPTGGAVVVGNTTAINSSKQSIYSGATNATTYNTLGLTGGSTLTIQQQQTTSVSTSATVILTPGQYGSFMVVFGSDGTNRFQDILNCSIGTGTVNVINSLTCSGTPGTRTYTQSSSTFRLQMSAGTYTVQVAALTTNG